MDSSKTTIILGPPGTGKTTALLTIVEDALAAGTSPKEIAFLSFTKKAADEGKERAMERFSLPESDFPYFKTLHAMAFGFLGMRREQTFGWQHLRELGEGLGMEFKGRSQLVDDADVYGMNAGDRMMFLEGISRNRMEPLKQSWIRAAEDSINWWELERFSSALKAFKQGRMLWDFTDMLERFRAAGASQMPRFKLLLVDEAQDLSALQWECIEQLAENSGQVYIVGDDRQSLFEWAGADTNRFIQLPGRVRVLGQSYRVPRSVHQIAETIASRITNKREVAWNPRDHLGSVNFFNSIDEVDMSKGTWLLLARNGYLLNELEKYCMSQGFSFNSVSRDPLKSPTLQAIKIWEELRRGESATADQILSVAKFMTPAEISPELLKKLKNAAENEQYYMGDLRLNGLHVESIWWQAMPKISPTERDYFLAVRKRKEPLLKKPRIQLSTIHASKGGQADHVVLLSDVSYRTYTNMLVDEDAEHRVWYVGATRCLDSLNIISPRTNLTYQI